MHDCHNDGGEIPLNHRAQSKKGWNPASFRPAIHLVRASAISSKPCVPRTYSFFVPTTSIEGPKIKRRCEWLDGLMVRPFESIGLLLTKSSDVQTIKRDVKEALR